MPTPILMYHAVTDADDREIPSAEIPYTVSTRAFKDQMSYLVDHGIETRTLDDSSDPHGRSVIITFDDGHATDCSTALPILTRHNQCAEFYVTTGWIGKDRYMDTMQIRQLAEAGMIVGTHGITHRYFDDLSEPECRAELKDSMSRLEDIVGEKIDGGSAPGGRLHADIRSIATDLGYEYLCTSNVGISQLPKAPGFQLVPRLVIGRATTMAGFAKLVAGKGYAIRLRQAKTHALGAAKRLLGNERYDRLRAKLLGETD